MIRLDVRIRIEAQEKGEYSTQTVIDRHISSLVPPGQDPMGFLAKLMTEEVDKVDNTFNQFPQYLALTSPPSQG